MVKDNLRKEQKLYSAVSVRLPLSGQLVSDEIEIQDKRIYLVGEQHRTRDAVDYVHKNTVPLIRENPNRWMILREGARAYLNVDSRSLLAQFPDFFYFDQLPKVFSLPVGDPIGDITSLETQQRIVASSDLTLDEVRGWYITCFIETNKSKMRGEKLRDACAERLGINLDELECAKEFAYNRSVHERLMRAWNASGRNELERILQKYPKIKNVLASVGIAHLPLFSDKYTCIG